MFKIYTDAFTGRVASAIIAAGGPAAEGMVCQWQHLNSPTSLEWLAQNHPELYRSLEESEVVIFFDWIDPHATEQIVANSRHCMAYADTLASGELCLVIGWSETFLDVVTLQEIVRHEMVHVEQIRSGRLIIGTGLDVVFDGVTYQGMPVPPPGTPIDTVITFMKYYSQPWEYEAMLPVLPQWALDVVEEFGTLWPESWDEAKFRASLEAEFSLQKAITAAVRD